MNSVFALAVQQRRILGFSYDGFHRRVETHVYGVTTAGNLAIRAFQVGGGSRSRSEPPWRLFVVSDMRAIVLLDDTFVGTRPEYKPRDRAFKRIIVALSP